MMTFTFATASFSVLLVVSAASVEDIPHNDHFSYTQRCAPSEQFIDQCNYCFCSPEGKHAGCTKMYCYEPEMPRIDNYKDGFACAPGKIFYDGCKSCTCAKSGNAAECNVMKDCENGVRRRRSVEDVATPFKRPNFPHIDNFHETGECSPGKMFYHECNACRCSIDGKSASCTRKGCPGYEDMRIDNYVEGQKCPPLKSFSDKCNSCQCSADGLSAVCTMMECPDYDFE